MPNATLNIAEIRLAVIEDEMLARVGIRAFLELCPEIRVVGEAETALHGLELNKIQQPDVVIVDLGLPDMDGVELIKKLKKQQPKLKIVVLTVEDKDRLILDALMAGADAYCLKEKISEELAEIIKAVFSGEGWLDSKVARKVISAIAERSIHKEISSNNLTIPTKLNLTEREHRILSLISQGKNNTEIAEDLYLSYHTIKSSITQILIKLKVQDRTQAAIVAIKNNLV